MRAKRGRRAHIERRFEGILEILLDDLVLLELFFLLVRLFVLNPVEVVHRFLTGLDGLANHPVPRDCVFRAERSRSARQR